jgi:hypothetical protein
MDDWGDSLKAAHADVAVAAFNLRLFERHRAPSDLQEFARENLSEALDRLEAEVPGMFVGHASEDAAWVDHLREQGLLPDDPPEGDD